MICDYLEKSQQKVLKFSAFIHVQAGSGSQFNCSIEATKIGINGFGRIGRMVFQAHQGGNVDGMERGPGIINDDLLAVLGQFYQRAYQEMVRSWIVFRDFLGI